MVVKKRKAPRRKLSTRFKQNPLQTTRAEFNKLGPVGKMAVVGVGAGAISATAAKQLNDLPFIGKVFKIFTGYGATLARKMK